MCGGVYFLFSSVSFKLNPELDFAFLEMMMMASHWIRLLFWPQTVVWSTGICLPPAVPYNPLYIPHISLRLQNITAMTSFLQSISASTFWWDVMTQKERLYLRVKICRLNKLQKSIYFHYSQIVQHLKQIFLFSWFFFSMKYILPSRYLAWEQM